MVLNTQKPGHSERVCSLGRPHEEVSRGACDTTCCPGLTKTWTSLPGIGDTTGCCTAPAAAAATLSARAAACVATSLSKMCACPPLVKRCT